MTNRIGIFLLLAAQGQLSPHNSPSMAVSWPPVMPPHQKKRKKKNNRVTFSSLTWPRNWTASALSWRPSNVAFWSFTSHGFAVNAILAFDLEARTPMPLLDPFHRLPANSGGKDRHRRRARMSLRFISRP